MPEIVSAVWAPLSKRFRTKRMAEFVKAFDITSQTTVLDVGGGRFNWELTPIRPRLTIVNPFIESKSA